MRRLAVGLLLAALSIAAAAYWAVQQDGPEGSRPFLGYVEAESIRVAPKRTGRLVALTTGEGRTVAAGEPLFALDAGDEEAAVEEAAARLARARARLTDLRAARQRQTEIDVLEAARRRVEAALDLSRAELERQQRLYGQGVIPEARLDQARTAFRRDASALAEAERRIEAARLPAREAEIEAAEAEVGINTAALARARIALADRTLEAPRGGRVLDILYRVGETVAAGQPVVEILPPENVVVRFYVPEPALAGLAHGQRVAVACDGCPAGLTATIRFIAGEAEFTPPVIFSRQERARLVFLVEARPATPNAALKPGLPVEVRPL